MKPDLVTPAAGIVTRAARALTAVIGAAVLAVATAAPVAAAETMFRIERMSDNVHAIVAKPTTVFNGNGMVIVMQDHLIVVDAHTSPIAARAAIRQIRAEVSTLPIRTLVISHGHLDHAHGIQAYVEEEGITPARIITSPAGVEGIRRTREDARNFIDFLSGKAAEFRAMLPGQTPAEAARTQGAIQDIDAYVSAMETVEITVPETIVTDHHRIQDAKLTVDIRFLGRGHTQGDLVVHVPTEGVIFTGDLVHGFEPLVSATESAPDDWVATLDAIAALDFHTFVGGHGGVFRDRETLTLVRAFLAELNAKVTAALDQGMTLDQAKAALSVDAFDTLSRQGLAGRVVEQWRTWLHPLYAPPIEGAVANTVEQTYRYHAAKRGG